MTLIILICAAVLVSCGLSVALAVALGAAAAKEDARRARVRRSLAPIPEVGGCAEMAVYAETGTRPEAGAYAQAGPYDGGTPTERNSRTTSPRVRARRLKQTAPTTGTRSSHAGFAFVRATVSFVPPLPRTGRRGGTLRFPRGLST